MDQPFRPLGAGRSHDPHDSLVFDRGCGHILWDSSGKAYIDFICGYSALNLGHAHPRLLAAARSQLDRLTYCTGGNTVPRQELERSLVSLVDGPGSEFGDARFKVWLSSTGARAVETAWKIAFANRPGKMMRFDLSYHGRSLATAHLSDTCTSEALLHHIGNHQQSQSDGVIPYPMCGSLCDGACRDCNASIAVAKNWLEHGSEQTSAMLLEPAIGARGYYFASSGYYRRLVQMVRSYNVQIISDEVQMGLGRLGSMIASIADRWIPDLIVLGKSLGGGITPISAVIGTSERMDRLPQGIESETFAANPIACKVASEVISVLNDESFMASILDRGDRFRKSLMRELPECIAVDGRGLATVIDLSRLPAASGAGSSATQVAWDWVSHAREKGLLVHLTGGRRDRIAVIPSLTVDEAVLSSAVEILSSFWKKK